MRIGADLSALLRAVQVPTMLMTNTGEDLFELARTKKFKDRLCEVRRVRAGSATSPT